MKALVITVYMGPLPANFALWLRSAAANPGVDFLVVSDREAPPLPANVSFRHETLDSLREHWSGVAGMPVALHSPYKLNDFKPIYWTLASHLNRYDYWGFCDLDVMFGKLEPFLDRALGHFDMILSEGHLRFLRNDEQTRQAWREIVAPRRWQDILADPANFGMDEHHGINRVFADGKRSWFADPGMVADIDPGFRQFRLLPQFRNARCQAFFWSDGGIWRESWSGGQYRCDEYLYIHLQKRRLDVTDDCLDAAAIDIGPRGFRPRDASRTAKDDLSARNPWSMPRPDELRILLREARRRLTGRASTFAAQGKLP